MDPRKDYYKTLGVPETAGEDEIRKAFRRLAKKYHPDLNPGDKSAESKFKEINEAHEVLSDKAKREEYDAVRKGVFTGGFGRSAGPFGQGAGPGAGRGGIFYQDADFGLDDLLGDLLGGRRGAAGFGATFEGMAGPDIQVEMTVDFLDMARGAEREIAYSRPKTCPSCGGTGRVNRRICPRCRGEGAVEAPERFTVRIPAGAQDGATIRIPGRGAEGRGRGKAGDLIVRLRTIPHPYFRREGSDILVDVPVNYSEAVKGAKIRVPTIDGPVTVTVPPGSSSGRKLRLKGRGVPIPGRAGRGDQYAILQVVVPRNVPADLLKLVERLAAFEDPDPRKALE